MSAYEKQSSPASPPRFSSSSSSSSRSVSGANEPAPFSGRSISSHGETNVPSGEKAYGEDGEPVVVDGSHASFVSGHASLAPEGDIESTRKLSRIYTGTQQDLEKVEVDYTGCPSMGGGRPYPPALPKKDAYEVTYDGPDDPTHPFNWSQKKKVWLCVWLCLDCISIAMGSSIFANAVEQICEIYHVIPVVAILGITLYVLGFAASPVVYAPLSELYGRRGVLVISSFGFAIFHFAVATAKDLQTIMICRFFAGFIGAAPMAVVPAAFTDMFDTNYRGKVMALFALGVFVGPIIGPVMGSYIVQHTTWRWLEYVTACFASFVFVGIVLWYDETHHATILIRKASELRKKSGNWGIRASHEDIELSIAEIAKKTITRPIYMLFVEPILFFITLYNSFVYGILYLMLEAYPIVFEEGYGLRKNGELPYLSLIVGMVICAAYIWYCETAYLRKVKQHGGLVPEARLYPMVGAGVIFPIGILWFCWTGNYPQKIHWACPTVAGGFTGFGLLGIFLPCLTYIIESYLMLAASAVAANTFMRSAFGACFPLFAGYMFRNMGTNWAGMVIGLFAAALIPVPLLFLKFGKRIRLRSKYAYSG